MSVKKWIPWNWFKNEEESAGNLHEGRIDGHDAQKGASESGCEANRSQNGILTVVISKSEASKPKQISVN